MGIYVYNSIYNPDPFTLEFDYTWSDQRYTVPYTWRYTIECFWAGSNTSAWWYAKGTFTLTAGDKLSIMVGLRWNATSWTTYGFWWSSNLGSDRAWGGLSGVFTWDATIQANDSARALIIGGWAWWGGRWAWWKWWGTEGENGGTAWYGTAWWWGTQTWRNGWGNVWANQFNWWNGSGTYGFGWWGGRYGWNSSIWDWSSDDDKWGWWGSGYVLSTATDRVLTQWGWSPAWANGKVILSFLG